MGTVDKLITEGQERILTLKKRDKHDTVIVQEKLDGANVAVAKENGTVYAVTRSGWLAEDSMFFHHKLFHHYVQFYRDVFNSMLMDGEHVSGEWMVMAHGTFYNILNNLFFPFDIINGNKRLLFRDFSERVSDYGFRTPYVVSVGDSISIDIVMNTVYNLYDTVSGIGAYEKREGAVWRVERKGVVDFLGKYVRGDKVDGKYLSKDDEKWNTVRGAIIQDRAEWYSYIQTMR